jgi:integrase
MLSSPHGETNGEPTNRMTVRAEHVRDDRYRVRIYVGKDPATGRTIQRGHYFRAKSQREADKLAPGFEAALRQTAKEGAAEKGTVAELVEEWQADRTTRTHSPATLYREKSIVARIVENLGAIPFKDLSPQDVNKFYRWLRTLEPNGRPLSESTVHHHARVLRAIIYHGESLGWIDRSAFRQAKKVQRPTVEITPPTPAVLAALYRDLPDNLRIPVLILVTTGIRRGELFALKWPYVDLDRGVMTVTGSVHEGADGELVDKLTKSGKARKVPLSTPLVAELDQWHRHLHHRSGGKLARDARVIPHLSIDLTGRTPMRPGWLSLAWRRHVTKHDERVRLHDLRHFYATYLLDSGVPLNTTQGLLGHHAPSVTLDIYGSRSAAGDKLAIEAAGALVDALAKDSSD